MNFNGLIPSATSTQLLSIRQIDLNDYYTSDPARQIIHCQICKLNILRKDVFEHTVSKRHKYNKLYIAISQNRCSNVDVDFVVLDINRLQCRYCDSILLLNIDSDNLCDSLIISHIHCRLIQNEQTRLNQLSSSSKEISTINQKSLQPLDSFITHDMKARKHVKKKAKKIQMKENLLEKTELMFKEQRFLSNVDQNIDQQYSLFSRDFQRQRGEEVPKFIIVEEGACRCNICMIELMKNVRAIGEHIDGKKHQKKIHKESTRFIDQNTKILDMKKNSPTKSVTDIKYTNYIVENNAPENLLFIEDFQRQRGEAVPKFIIVEEGACRCNICMIELTKNVRTVGEHIDGKKHQKKMHKESTRFIDQNTNNMVENNVSENSLFSKDFKKKRGEEVPKFIIIGEGASCKCTICMIEIPKTTYNVGGHIDGKKHQKKMHEESTRIIDQNTKILDMKKNSPTKSVTDIKDTNYIVENNAPENLLFIEDFQRQRGEAVPKFIIIEEGACRCNICMIELTKNVRTVGEHIDGKKHQKKIHKESTRFIDQNTKILDMKIKSPTKSVTDIKDTNYIVENNAPENLLFIEDFQRQRGEAVPKFIIIEGGTCRCNICMINLTKNVRNVGDHIDGIKHQKKMHQESSRLMDQNTKILDMNKKSPAQPVLSKYCKIEEALKDIRKTNNMVENNVSENSLFSEDFKKKRGEEVPKFIIVGEGASCKCTICTIEIPKTTYNVGGHIDGKKHRKNCTSTSSVHSTKILSTSNSIDEHMNDDYHRYALIKGIVEHLKAQTQKLELPALNKLPSTSLSNVKNGMYVCTTCDVFVSNTESCIEQHNSGRKHINKMLQPFGIL